MVSKQAPKEQKYSITKNLSNVHSIYKQLRSSDILKFEKVVPDIVRVLEEDYLNPFGANFDESCLYNLSLGEVLPADIADVIANVTLRD